MAIKPTCDKCGQELNDFGAILLSPPDAKNMVQKFHFCKACYQKMTSTNSRFKLIPAVYLVLRRVQEVLLLRRANTGYQDGKYSLVAGHLDGDELATEGLAREAKEEAGIIIKPADLKLVHTAHRLSRGQTDQERVDLFFEATKWQGNVRNTEPQKCDDLSWHDINNLPDNMLPFVKHVLIDIAQGTNYSEYADEPIK